MNPCPEQQVFLTTDPFSSLSCSILADFFFLSLFPCKANKMESSSMSFTPCICQMMLASIALGGLLSLFTAQRGPLCLIFFISPFLFTFFLSFKMQVKFNLKSSWCFLLSHNLPCVHFIVYNTVCGKPYINSDRSYYVYVLCTLGLRSSCPEREFRCIVGAQSIFTMSVNFKITGFKL